MKDLDAALRTMLRERAGDITELPPGLLAMTEDELDVGPTRRLGHGTAWAVAAAVACVLLVVAAVAALRPQPSGRQHPVHVGTAVPHPTAPPTSTTTMLRLPTSLPPTAHAARTVSLASVAIRPLPGYVVHERDSKPGYRSVALRATADHGVPVGCNGCESASAYVYVFDVGRFNATAHGISGWTRVTVNGHAAYLGTTPQIRIGGTHRVPTLAWRFASDRWALVQGVTAYGGTTASLMAVAAAAEPNRAAPVELPFRLTWIPDLPVTDFFDDRSEGYDVSLTLGHNDDTRYNNPEISISVSANDPKSVSHTSAHRVTIDHRTGWYDRAGGGADIPVPGGTLEIGIADTGALSEQERTTLDRVLAGLRIPRSGTQVTAEQAVP